MNEIGHECLRLRSHAIDCWLKIVFKKNPVTIKIQLVIEKMGDMNIFKNIYLKEKQSPDEREIQESRKRRNKRVNYYREKNNKNKKLTSRFVHLLRIN